MKRSQYLLYTVKENPKEAVVVSHILMVRTGMIKQLSSGVYSYLPLALRSLRKVEQIIREELDRAGCQELLMPMVQPAELWRESGRWQHYGKELLRLKDRKDNDYCLGPTHEEVITDIVRHHVRSYKDLPLNLYQIQTKFRDEIRPRFGLMRGREFLMKDAYSFDTSDENADTSYWKMFEAYKRIFERCGLDFRPVEADSGAIGGSFTHEFHVLAGSGEDEILSCNHCDYAANIERCETLSQPAATLTEATNHEPRAVETPNCKSIEAVAAFLNVPPAQCMKMLVYRDQEGSPLAALLPGDSQLNETALRNAAGASEIEMINDGELRDKYGLHVGYLGPVDWPKEIPLYVDSDVYACTEVIVGANRPNYHLSGVVPGRHIKATKTLTLRSAQAGDLCPRCRIGGLSSFRGIEVGHVFKLGTKYSQALNATFLDSEGKDREIVMGCYGVGVGRTMAAAIEQNHDKDGIIWPIQIAPFQINLLNLDPKSEDVTQTTENIYQALQLEGIEVLLDDTQQRPGFKFKDADLIGIPLHIIVGGRSLKEGVVEFKLRKSGKKHKVPVGEAVETAIKQITELGWRKTS